MPSLKDLKNRIASVKSTRKITKAMQMVAAAKLRRAQDAAEAARPYTERFNAVMAGLAAGAASSPSAPRLLAGTGRDDVHLLVVMTSERGLCGGFNSTISRLARQRAEELLRQGKTVKILTVGKKGREALKRDHASRFVNHVDLSAEKRMGYDVAQRIARDIIARFEAGMLNHLRTRRRDVLDMITTQDPKIGGEAEQAIRSALDEFARDFA